MLSINISKLSFLSRYLQQIWRAVNILALHRVYALVIYCIIATIFRHHLFVWTVFSPKLLYDFVATVFSVQALSTIAQIEALAHATNWLAKTFTYRSKLWYKGYILRSKKLRKARSRILKSQNLKIPKVKIEGSEHLKAATIDIQKETSCK